MRRASSSRSSTPWCRPFIPSGFSKELHLADSHNHSLMANRLERICQVRCRMCLSRALGATRDGARQCPAYWPLDLRPARASRKTSWAPSWFSRWRARSTEDRMAHRSVERRVNLKGVIYRLYALFRTLRPECSDKVFMLKYSCYFLVVRSHEFTIHIISV